MKGAFIGLNWKHTRGHMFRAVMEGIAYEYQFYLDVLRKLYPNRKFTQMRAIGGGAKSELFAQIKADVLGMDVVPCETGDTAPIGSAVIAGVSAGVFSDYRAPISAELRERVAIRYDKQRHEVYKPYAQTYLEALEAIAPIYKNGKIYAGK